MPTRWPVLRPDKGHRPTIAGGSRLLHCTHAACPSLADQRESLPSHSILCRMLASLRATVSRRPSPLGQVKVTDQRTARDFAHCMRDLADIHYAVADRIRVVLDNLSTHTAGALYETFPASEAHRILQRLEFHYTPKHASWLNMVEIESGVLRGQCLDRRIGERERLVSEIEAWQHRRNTAGARVNWKFTTQKARHKLTPAYPDIADQS
jgi:hypothetical protein